MVKVLGKFENRDIEIARVNSILISKSINLKLFTLIFPLWSKAILGAQSIYREVYAYNYPCVWELCPFIEKSMPIIIRVFRSYVHL